MTDWEEVYQFVKGRSDHQDRIISELNPALVEALPKTPASCPALEIGTQAGGSAIYTLWILSSFSKRNFITCDASEINQDIPLWAQKLGIEHKHYKMSQEEFVRDHRSENGQFGFIFFDADHNYESVKRDIGLITNDMVQGAVIAVDDVQNWPELPDFDGLERLTYEGVNQGGYVSKDHGQHIAYYRRK